MLIGLLKVLPMEWVTFDADKRQLCIFWGMLQKVLRGTKEI